MSGVESPAEVTRSLIAMARCPRCRRDVYLGSCQPREEIQTIHLDDQTTPIAASMPRWWECEHLADNRTPHRWETTGPIEIRPVPALPLTCATTRESP